MVRSAPLLIAASLWVSCASARRSEAAESFPVGRWSGELLGVPSGTLGSAASHTALLGNGYMGVAHASQKSPVPLGEGARKGEDSVGSSVELWINSNANWDCESSGKALPPALCSTRQLGVLSIAVLGESFAPNATRFETEQRIANGTLWTRRVASDGATLETQTYIHPEQNVIVVEVLQTTAAGRPPPDALEATLVSFGPNRHVKPTTSAACVSESGPSWSAACSRRYHAKGSASGFRAPWSALAMTSDGGAAPSHVARANMTASGYELEYVTAAFSPAASGASTSVRLVVALADNLLGGSEDDPTSAAVKLAAASDADEVRNASCAFWSAYWAASSISLPTRPAIRDMWLGAQYMTAGAMPSEKMVARLNGRAPPPGLYGPWTTADFAFWNGDLTLDYNQEGAFYHVYSSNHPERAAGYFPPVTDWMQAAQLQATHSAAAANLSCPSHALHFACHLAPWGYQSRDTSVYGHYEGPFAALLFINHWEYTRDASFAKTTTLPLLDGINAWSHCYLHRGRSSNGSLVLEDWNAISPDEVLENNPVRNPITGTSLIRRVATAQRDIATALGVSYPPYIDEIIAHLVPPRVDAGPDGKSVWVVADGVGWLNSTYKYGRGMGLFPLWPAETVDGLTMDTSTRAVVRASLSLYGNLSCAPHYPRPPFNSCVDAGLDTLIFFSAAARALATGGGGGGGEEGFGAGDAGVTARDLADALEMHVAAYGANSSNLLAYAPGGGVETAGLAQSVNDMLVQSDGTHISLFPAWPKDEPASFRTLRVKGAFVVSAAWDAARRTAYDVEVRAEGDAEWCGLLLGKGRAATVRCSAGDGDTTSGGAVSMSLCGDSSGRARWRVARGARCKVALGGSCNP